MCASHLGRSIGAIAYGGILFSWTTQRARNWLAVKQEFLTTGAAAINGGGTVGDISTRYRW